MDSSQLKDVHVCVFFFCCFFLLEVSPFCQFCLSQNNSSDMSSRGRPRDIWARVYSIAILSNAVRQNSDVLKMLFIDYWRKRDSCAEQGSNGSCWLVYIHTHVYAFETETAFRCLLLCVKVCYEMNVCMSERE